jgi:hypothetical protein
MKTAINRAQKILAFCRAKVPVVGTVAGKMENEKK